MEIEDGGINGGMQGALQVGGNSSLSLVIDFNSVKLYCMLYLIPSFYEVCLL